MEFMEFYMYKCKKITRGINDLFNHIYGVVIINSSEASINNDVILSCILNIMNHY